MSWTPALQRLPLTCHLFPCRSVCRLRRVATAGVGSSGAGVRCVSGGNAATQGLSCTRPQPVPLRLRSSADLHAYLHHTLLPLHTAKREALLQCCHGAPSSSAASHLLASLPAASLFHDYAAAERCATVVLWVTFSALSLVLVLLFVGTYRTYSWNVIEPITYLCGGCLTWACVLWFKHTKGEFSFLSLRKIIVDWEFSRRRRQRDPGLSPHSPSCQLRAVLDGPVRDLEADVRRLEDHIGTIQAILASREKSSLVFKRK